MSLLIKEPPLQVLPSLASKIGLNEAIFIQQVHYWSMKSSHEHDGRMWVYNTIQQWQDQFPFWSERTIKTIISNLKDSGILIIDQLGKKFDRTNYYAVDYDKIGLLDGAEVAQSSGRSCPLYMGQKLPHLLPENTETTNRELVPAEPDTLQVQCREVWKSYSLAYFNRWGTNPVRNAKVNTLVKQLVQRIGADAPAVASYYLTSNDSFIVKRFHDFGLLVSQCESFRTQWATGASMTQQTARNIDTMGTYQNTIDAAVALVEGRTNGH